MDIKLKMPAAISWLQDLALSFSSLDPLPLQLMIILSALAMMHVNFYNVEKGSKLGTKSHDQGHDEHFYPDIRRQQFRIDLHWRNKADLWVTQSFLVKGCEGFLREKTNSKRSFSIWIFTGGLARVRPHWLRLPRDARRRSAARQPTNRLFLPSTRVRQAHLIAGISS